MRILSRAILLGIGLAVGLLPAGAWAQTSSGKIVGAVKDSSGGLLPGVTIVAKNLATGTKRDTVTNDRGEFELSGLAPGRYQLDAELSGFRSYSQGPVTVRVNEETRVDPTLSVGALNETVTVEAEGIPLAGRERRALVEEWLGEKRVTAARHDEMTR